MTEEQQSICRLLARRQAALATLSADGPAQSFVRYAVVPHAAELLLLVSGLAAHTAQMAADGRTALLISAGEQSHPDPQQRARLSLRALAAAVDPADYAAAAADYQAQLPLQRPLFGLADFRLIRLQLRDARYVGGFARARDITVAELVLLCTQAAQLPDA